MEVRSRFSRSDHKGQGKFLYFWISCLYIDKSLADVIHQPLVLFSSLTRAFEVAYSVTARYRYSGSPSMGFESNYGLLRYSLSDPNAYSYFSSHKNLLLPFNESNKGRHSSVALEMNLLRAATLSVKL